MAKKCKYEKALRGLVGNCQEFMRWLDAEMMKPSTNERGKRIAQATNSLNMAVDNVRYFTLGVDYRKDKNPTFGKRRGKLVADYAVDPAGGIGQEGATRDSKSSSSSSSDRVPPPPCSETK
jgi:hypothetical protein